MFCSSRRQGAKNHNCDSLLFPGQYDGIRYWQNLKNRSGTKNPDILEIDEIRNPALLRQVFELACIESAREISLTKMQGTINSGTVPTIKSYLDALDKTMLVKPLQKYSPSPVKEKNSIPKMQAYNSAFIVGPEGLPLEDFFSIDLKTFFRKKQA